MLLQGLSVAQQCMCQSSQGSIISARMRECFTDNQVKCVMDLMLICCVCSRHPAAGLHAAARAVSGAAVYVSDKPGQHDFSILKQLVLQDGSVLRALLPGRPTADCLFKDPLRDKQTVLKVRLRLHVTCCL